MGKAFFLGWVFLFNFNRPHKRGLIFSRLAGETAIATGGTVGICRACATRRVEEGAEVALLRYPKGREVQVPLGEVTQARMAFHWKR
jgi:ribosome maturation factor RimP